MSRVARWITTVGPADLATALKSGLIYYYVLLLLFGYLYPYNIMPREIPRSRRYVTVQLPRDRDLIFRIGHNLGHSTPSCYAEYYLSPQLFHGPSKMSLYLSLPLSLSLLSLSFSRGPRSPGREIAFLCARDRNSRSRRDNRFPARRNCDWSLVRRDPRDPTLRKKIWYF